MLKSQLKENVPGIGTAPIGRKVLKPHDYDYLERKVKLNPTLPFYNKDEIARRKYPYYIVLLHEMIQQGYKTAVKELAQIFHKEEQNITKAGISKFQLLVASNTKVYMIADILKASEEYEKGGLYETASMIRRQLGLKLMKELDVGLSKYFFRTALLIAEKSKESSVSLDRLQAEIHCLLAFIAREFSENMEKALESAVEHLVICRNLSKEQSWHFEPQILSIRLKKPISLHGIRDEYEIIDACTMSLYMIATLLEHEMMLGLANQILHAHRYPTDQDIAQSHVFADNALKLAFEVHQSVALSSALLRFGIILRHAGEYEDAVRYFKQLSNLAEVKGDSETFAIAQHNIAMTFMAKHRSMEALECLTKQKEIADKNGIIDLQADALEEIGLILLQEGQLWESEECYSASYEAFKTFESERSINSYKDHCARNLAMWGIAAGHQLWSRFSGLVRNGSAASIIGLIDWKCRRAPLPKVPRPDYTMEKITDVFEPYHLESMEDEEEEEEEEETFLPPTQIESEIGLVDGLTTLEVTISEDIHQQKLELKTEEEAYMSDFNHSTEEDLKIKRELDLRNKLKRQQNTKHRRRHRHRSRSRDSARNEYFGEQTKSSSSSHSHHGGSSSESSRSGSHSHSSSLPGESAEPFTDHH